MIGFLTLTMRSFSFYDYNTPMKLFFNKKYLKFNNKKVTRKINIQFLIYLNISPIFSSGRFFDIKNIKRFFGFQNLKTFTLSNVIRLFMAELSLPHDKLVCCALAKTYLSINMELNSTGLALFNFFKHARLLY